MNNYILLLIWAICSAGIYMDAKKRNLKNPAAWALMGLLLGILGVLGYLFIIVRPNKTNV